MAKWQNTQYSGVRYREHPSRKHGVGSDKYFSIRYQADGQRREEGLGWSSAGWTAKKAMLELERLREAAKTGEGPVRLQEKRDLAKAERERVEAEKEQRKRDEFTFGDLMTKYLKWAQTNKKTGAKDAERYKNHLAEQLGAKPLKDITPFLLEGVKRSLEKKGLAPATTKHCLVIIRQAFNKAVVWGFFEGNNPIKGVKLPKLDNKKERVLTDEEEAVLMDALLSVSIDVHNMAKLSLYAGFRFGEIADLRWRNVDFDLGVISVIGKGSKRRMVPMNETAGEVLRSRRIPGGNGESIIFPDRNGSIRTEPPKSYYEVVKRLGLNQGADRSHKIDFHSLRHTYATRLASHGTPLTVLRDLLGHADLTMVSRYAHVMPGTAKEAVASLDKPREQPKVVKLRRSSGE